MYHTRPLSFSLSIGLLGLVIIVLPLNARFWLNSSPVQYATAQGTKMQVTMRIGTFLGPREKAFSVISRRPFHSSTKAFFFTPMLRLRFWDWGEGGISEGGEGGEGLGRRKSLALFERKKQTNG